MYLNSGKHEHQRQECCVLCTNRRLKQQRDSQEKGYDRKMDCISTIVVDISPRKRVVMHAYRMAPVDQLRGPFQRFIYLI